ncbi:8994_t:CDS:1, partial [Gigaspora rosea]
MHLGPNEDSIEGAIKDEDIFLNPPPNLDDHLDHPIIYPINGGNIQPRHYKLLIAITSQIDEIRTRKLLREYMFGIRNNLKPCMENNGDIYYKFLVKPYNQAEKKVLRDFTAEV